MDVKTGADTLSDQTAPDMISEPVAPSVIGAILSSAPVRSGGEGNAAPVKIDIPSIRAGDVTMRLDMLQQAVNKAKAAAGRVNAAASKHDGHTWTRSDGSTKTVNAVRQGRSNGGQRINLVPEGIAGQLLAAKLISSADAKANRALNKLASALEELSAL